MDNDTEIPIVPFPKGELCPNCGKGEVTQSIVVDRFPYVDGQKTVELSATVVLNQCNQCRFEFLDASAEQARHNAVCAYLHVLNPKAIASIREKHGFSRAAFAELTRLGEATIARWERGALIQNAANDQFLYLLSFVDNIRRLETRARGASDVSIPAPRRFRLLEQTPKLLEAQDSFELHRAGR